MLPKDCLLLRKPLGHSLNVSPSVCHTCVSHNRSTPSILPKEQQFLLRIVLPSELLTMQAQWGQQCKQYRWVSLQ